MAKPSGIENARLVRWIAPPDDSINQEFNEVKKFISKSKCD